MKKPQTNQPSKQAQEYMDSYSLSMTRVYALSRMKTRQFLGTREPNDPRVAYLTEVEAFKNASNAMMSVTMRLFTEVLGVNIDRYLLMHADEMGKMVANMMEELGVVDWNEDGTPKLDLQKYSGKTAGWPQ